MKKTAKIEPAAIGGAIVLSVGMNDVDGVALESILHEFCANVSTKAEWTPITRATLASTFSVLRKISIPIVLCDCDLMACPWQEVLGRISVFRDPPLFIVTSRLADARLWAEALNLGAYDALVKPFDAAEVIRILSLAWQHWRERHGVYSSLTEQRKAAACS